LKINRVPDSLKDKICTKFGQNPLKDVDPRVFTRMLWKDGRTDGSVTISLRNFVGEGIIIRNSNVTKDVVFA
jgi:hypothetical protein